MKRATAAILICGMLGMQLSGCGKQVDEAVLESTSIMVETELETTSKSEAQAEVMQQSEEYVYDYQVSTDPIPKEIADLGGPCQGTIHAFPSQIAMGLTEKKIEEDPELKAEVEKRIPEVEQYLAENVGGEFRVDGVAIRNEFDWELFFTNVESGYQFSLVYSNDEYYAVRTGTISRENTLHMENYSDKNEEESINQMVGEVLKCNYGECPYATSLELEGRSVIIYIAQFSDGEVEKENEQIRILNLWKALEESNSEISYAISVSYYPIGYRDIIEQRANEGVYYYDWAVPNCDYKLLMENGELLDNFWYHGFLEDDEEDSLDAMLESYEKGTYDKGKIWRYWSL